MPHILVVDDDRRIVALLRDHFSAGGYSVETAFNGGDALMHAREEMPDVMLLDIRMPGMDGFEVLREIRTLTPRLPVVMLTGAADADVAQEALRRGACGYLAKPVDLAALDRCIETVLGHGARGRSHDAGNEPLAAVRNLVLAALDQAAPALGMPLSERITLALAEVGAAAHAGNARASLARLAALELLLRVAADLGDLSLDAMLAVEAEVIRLRRVLLSSSEST